MSLWKNKGMDRMDAGSVLGVCVLKPLFQLATINQLKVQSLLGHQPCSIIQHLTKTLINQCWPEDPFQKPRETEGDEKKNYAEKSSREKGGWQWASVQEAWGCGAAKFNMETWEVQYPLSVYRYWWICFCVSHNLFTLLPSLSEPIVSFQPFLGILHCHSV